MTGISATLELVDEDHRLLSDAHVTWTVMSSPEVVLGYGAARDELDRRLSSLRHCRVDASMSMQHSSTNLHGARAAARSNTKDNVMTVMRGCNNGVDSEWEDENESEHGAVRRRGY